MMVWAREVAGWLLVLLGLLMCYLAYELIGMEAREPRPVDAAVVAVMGIFIFRGGIHLLKVAIAARICREGARPTHRA
jgi:hypothetical protein